MSTERFSSVENLSLTHILVFLLVILFSLSQAFRSYASESASIEALINCVVAAGSEGKTIAVGFNSLSGESQFGFYFKDKSGAWQKGPFYQGEVQSVIKRGGEYYAVGPEVADVYNAEGKWVRTTPWLPAWDPLAAAEVNGELFAFGMDPAPGKPAPGAPAPPVVRVAKLQETKWVEMPELSFRLAPAAKNQICVVPAGSPGQPVQVMWITAKDKPRPVLHREAFSGTGWEYLPGLILPSAQMRIAAAQPGGNLLIFALDLDNRISEKHPLLYAQVGLSDTAAARAGLLRTALAPVAGLRDPPLLDRTHFVAAFASGGKTGLCLLSNAGLGVASFDSGKVGTPVPVVQVRLFQQMKAALVYGLLGAAYLVLLGFSLWRSRKWVREIEFEGQKMKLASWRDRVGAFLVDSCMLMAGVLIPAVAFGGGTDWTQGVVAFTVGPQSIWLSLLWALYFVVMESQRGQTLGKRLFRIAVVSYDLKPPMLHHVLIRNMVRLIEPAAVGLIVVLNLKTSQRVGDLFAGTFVVKLPPPADTHKHGEDEIDGVI